MTDDEIRKIVKTKLADGTLPRSLPVAARPGESIEPFVVGSSLADRCVVCGESATQLRYTRQSVAFHDRCHRIWREETGQENPALRKKQYHRGYSIEVASREDPPREWRSRWTAIKLGASDAHSKSDFVSRAHRTESDADAAALRAACAWIDLSEGKH